MRAGARGVGKADSLAARDCREIGLEYPARMEVKRLRMNSPPLAKYQGPRPPRRTEIGLGYRKACRVTTPSPQTS